MPRALGRRITRKINFADYSALRHSNGKSVVGFTKNFLVTLCVKEILTTKALPKYLRAGLNSN